MSSPRPCLVAGRASGDRLAVGLSLGAVVDSVLSLGAVVDHCGLRRLRRHGLLIANDHRDVEVRVEGNGEADQRGQHDHGDFIHGAEHVDRGLELRELALTRRPQVPVVVAPLGGFNQQGQFGVVLLEDVEQLHRRLDCGRLAIVHESHGSLKLRGRHVGVRDHDVERSLAVLLNDLVEVLQGRAHGGLAVVDTVDRHEESKSRCRSND